MIKSNLEVPEIVGLINMLTFVEVFAFESARRFVISLDGVKGADRM